MLLEISRGIWGRLDQGKSAQKDAKSDVVNENDGSMGRCMVHLLIHEWWKFISKLEGKYYNSPTDPMG